MYAFVTAEIDAEVFCGLLGLGYNIGNSGLRIDVHGLSAKNGFRVAGLLLAVVSLCFRVSFKYRF